MRGACARFEANACPVRVQIEVRFSGGVHSGRGGEFDRSERGRRGTGPRCREPADQGQRFDPALAGSMHAPLVPERCARAALFRVFNENGKRKTNIAST